MRIIFLGTAAAVPTAHRGLPCVCVEREGDLIIFDVGEGAQMAFARAGLGWNRNTTIFVTHLHGDHCLGLPGLIQTMSMQGRSKPLLVYGPEGTARFVTGTLHALGFSPPFDVVVYDIEEGVVYDAGGYSIISCRAEHAIPALAYMLTETEKPGKFHPDRARALGIPEGPQWKTLQVGGSVQVGGRTIVPEDVLGSSRSGRNVGYSGDTRPTTKLERFFAGCDYLVFDSTFTDEHSAKAEETGHSTATEAATLAHRAGVKNLILTHFSARYTSATAHLVEARRMHPSVTAAADMLSISI